MAMFNLEFGGDQQAKKPMRSYIDIDADGRPKARVYADEYDAVKSNPDFQPYLAGAGRNMQTAQDSFADEMNEARIEAVEKRIKAKRQETIRAETEAREAAGTGNEYPGIDILGRMIGSQTFAQRATTRQEELKKLLEERAGYMGTPEISAPMESAESAQEPEPMVAQQQQAQRRTGVKIRNPDGKIATVPSDVWNRDSKKYIEMGYQVVP
ncbi:MAG: hypothetical protein EBZ49_04805 [Proteobacteria bacterium]|nr:hypothetical protein [Pseudomonadota bacterium]